ncbi:hypothetical protein ACIA8F_24015 [Streptomyces sp. NPDC051563]|uniref:hypothetical protein n=1 Tax=Streptomyces sp. NPDC051563 TaxID=3365659 RepID=UPI00378D0579
MSAPGRESRPRTLLEARGLDAAAASGGVALLERPKADAGSAGAPAEYARPWDGLSQDVPAVHVLLNDGVHQLEVAVGELTENGSANDKSAAAKVFVEARQALYKLLADGE